MRVRKAAAALSFLAAATSVAEVRESGTERRLSLGAGPPSLAMPRDDWSQQGERWRADKVVVYYLYTSDRHAAAFSVYINGAPSCNTADACLDVSLTNPMDKEAKDLKRGRSGAFSFAHFHVDKPAGLPVHQTHVQASALVGGRWFDVHISTLGTERPDPAPLLAILESLSVD